VINAITNKLDALYPDIPIRDAAAEQGFKGPCFFVQRITGSREDLVSNRALRSMTFNVQYIPASRESADSKLDDLYEGMQQVQDGEDIYLAKSISDKVNDNVLHMIVTYKYTLIKVEDNSDLMQKLKVNNT